MTRCKPRMTRCNVLWASGSRKTLHLGVGWLWCNVLWSSGSRKTLHLVVGWL